MPVTAVTAALFFPNGMHTYNVSKYVRTNWNAQRSAYAAGQLSLWTHGTCRECPTTTHTLRTGNARAVGTCAARRSFLLVPVAYIHANQGAGSLLSKIVHSVSQSVSHYHTPTNGAHGPLYTLGLMSALRNLRAKGVKGRWHLPARQIFFILPRRVVCASARRAMRRWRQGSQSTFGCT